jgi:membrane protein DedA with SNARE-associated domain
MEHLTHTVLDLIRAHPDLAALLIGATAFAESFALISFLVPGTTILVAAGTLVTKGVLDPVTTASAAAVGAILGDAISYWIGLAFGRGLPNHWPFRTHRHTLERGVHFFEKYGWASVFIGRFFGPLRAFVPLVAGMCRMPVVPFYSANIISAVIWAPALLYSGYLIGLVYQSNWTPHQKLLVFAAAALVFVMLAYLTRRIFQHHAK